MLNNNRDGICAAGCPVAVNSRLVTWQRGCRHEQKEGFQRRRRS